MCKRPRCLVGSLEARRATFVYLVVVIGFPGHSVPLINLLSESASSAHCGRTAAQGSSPGGIPKSAPGEEVSCHTDVIRGAEGTVGERNRSRPSRLEDRKSCVRIELMNRIPQSMQEVPGDEGVGHPYSRQCNQGKEEDCSRFNPPGLLTSEIHGERQIKAGDHDQIHRVEDLLELRRQKGLRNIRRPNRGQDTDCDVEDEDDGKRDLAW